MIYLVRKSSDSPNITNKDDVRMIRYAYGGYDGVLKNYGQELEATYALNILTIGSGRVVVQGWEIDIDEAGAEFTFSYATTGTQYHTIYLEVNAGTEDISIKSTYNTYESYPNIDKGNDLTEIPNGIARLPLFQATVYNGTVTKITKIVPVISYTKDKFNNILEEDKQTVKKATTVTTNIGDVAIADIFETDGKTAKTSTIINGVSLSDNSNFKTHWQHNGTGLYAVLYYDSNKILWTDMIIVQGVGKTTYGIKMVGEHPVLKAESGRIWINSNITSADAYEIADAYQISKGSFI